jgi:hypothetical protein
MKTTFLLRFLNLPALLLLNGLLTVRIGTLDVIIRYLRVRLGDSSHGQGSLQGKDAIDISEGADIPDAWEIDNSLNPTDPADGNRVGADGYTQLERYLNEIGRWEEPRS